MVNLENIQDYDNLISDGKFNELSDFDINFDYGTTEIHVFFKAET